MVSWQGTDGPGRGIGSVPSVTLAPACSGSRIESVMTDRVLGGPPPFQREAAGRKRCPETDVEKFKRRMSEMVWGGGGAGGEQRLRERGSETQEGERLREKGTDTQRGRNRQLV